VCVAHLSHLHHLLTEQHLVLLGYIADAAGVAGDAAGPGDGWWCCLRIMRSF
jgi:hypothetical protein